MPIEKSTPTPDRTEDAEGQGDLSARHSIPPRPARVHVSGRQTYLTDTE